MWKLDITNNLNHMNKCKILMIFLLFISCEPNKTTKLNTYLTNDSISMWDITMERYVELKDTSYIHRYFRSISFSSDFNCERYAKTIYNDRMIDFLGPEPNYLGLCNKWEILNDSIVKLNCRDIFEIKIINKDTLFLLDSLGIKKHEMYRVKVPWNIDKELIQIRNEKVESGEYLDKKVYNEWW